LLAQAGQKPVFTFRAERGRNMLRNFLTARVHGIYYSIGQCFLQGQKEEAGGALYCGESEKQRNGHNVPFLCRFYVF